MQLTRRTFSLVLGSGTAAGLRLAVASDAGYAVVYDGGTIPETKAGSDLKLYLDSNDIRFVKGKSTLISIPPASVTEISYGQDVHRRVGTAVAAGVFTLGITAYCCAQ